MTYFVSNGTQNRYSVNRILRDICLRNYDDNKLHFSEETSLRFD